MHGCKNACYFYKRDDVQKKKSIKTNLNAWMQATKANYFIKIDYVAYMYMPRTTLWVHKMLIKCRHYANLNIKRNWKGVYTMNHAQV